MTVLSVLQIFYKLILFRNIVYIDRNRCQNWKLQGWVEPHLTTNITLR